MKFGIVVFPGSNCDEDAFCAATGPLGQQAVYLWHDSADLQGCDCIILPGGFSYGDYLRTGAIAAQAVIMDSVRRFAKSGGLVLGICNGFQILCESGLLPGALVRNSTLRFRCHSVSLKVERNDTPYTTGFQAGQVISIPINHGEGNYLDHPDAIARLERSRQVVFRYCDLSGKVTPDANPNGSANNIAGICNQEGNILGMMPHPERVVEALIGGSDGLPLFQSIVSSAALLGKAGAA